MRRWTYLMMALALGACAALTGCGNAAVTETTGTAAAETTAQTTEQTGATTEETSAETTADAATEPVEEATVNVTEAPPSVTLPKVTDTLQDGTPVDIQNTGKLRITYTGDISAVRYITSVEELPKNEAFARYDEAYFQTHALVLVTETVGSGSVQVEIEAIHVDGEAASVTLSHQMPGQAGTTDMATWLLWAEVESGMNYRWSVANSAVKNAASTR